jgi:hypothetical protein
MSASSWADALDELEELLRRQEAAVSARVTLPVSPLPVVDGPIPEELRPRAVALLSRCRSLEDRVAEALDEHRRRLPAFAAGRARGADLGLL